MRVETRGGRARRAAKSYWIALDQLLLAIHEVDVVAEEEVKVFVSVARQPQLDRIELEQQVVAEGADQRQPRILRIPKLLDQARAEGKRREGCLLRSSSGKRSASGFKLKRESALGGRSALDVRMVR